MADSTESAAKHSSDPKFRGLGWRAGNALVGIFARIGIGPIALLTTIGRVTARPHTVPVVPIEHKGARWLVAPYGPVDWVHNIRAGGTVDLRHGRHRDTYVPREAGPAEAGPVLKRYVAVATKTRDCFAAGSDAPVEAFVAEAEDHPVFELQPPGESAGRTD
ncbi:MAG: nitroreductase family deazaflavin-dependent oxidoreductase [Solirubrobacterales bacterium]